MRSTPLSLRCALWCAALLCSTGLGPPANAQGQIDQSLDAFYSPSAAVFSRDGRTLYVTNAARGDYGMVEGRGAISRVSVGPDGVLTMETPRLVTSLSAPVAIEIMGGASTRVPSGSLVVAVGGSWVVDRNDRRVEDDRERGTGLAFFNPDTGEDLGRIFLGEGSVLVDLIGKHLTDPTAIATDAAGNIYLADVAGLALNPSSSGLSSPGLFKLTPEAIDALLDDRDPPEGSVVFGSVPELPTGLTYSTRSDALVWVTGRGDGKLGGAAFRLPRGDSSGRNEVETVVGKLGPLVGVAETPSGTLIAGRNDGNLVYIRGRKARQLKLKRDPRFLSPGQPAVAPTASGRLLLIVPELSGAGSSPWRNSIKAILLPGDF